MFTFSRPASDFNNWQFLQFNTKKIEVQSKQTHDETYSILYVMEKIRKVLGTQLPRVPDRITRWSNLNIVSLGWITFFL